MIQILNAFRNEGSVDRAFRLSIGVAILLASVAFQFWLGIVPALILMVTGVVGICPLYLPFRFSTFAREKQNATQPVNDA